MSNNRLQADSLHTTIDRVFLVLHIEQCEEALKLFASLQDRATEIQTCIHEGRILCFAYLDFSLQNINMDECVMIELDLRTCLHTDLQVFKIPPLENERFQVDISNTARVRVNCVTAFNLHKIHIMGYECSNTIWGSSVKSSVFATDPFETGSVLPKHSPTHEFLHRLRCFQKNHAALLETLL